MKIRLVSLPLLDLTPIYVAQNEGIFTKHGVELEVISVSSGPEKDSILAVGEADVAIGEFLATLVANQEETQFQIVTGSKVATKENPTFSIIAAGNSGIENLEDLKGVEIAASEGTINNYVMDRILKQNGFADEDIEYVFVPRIPERLTLLDEGELRAATLPTNVGLIAAQQGAKILADDGEYPVPFGGGWMFRKEFIDENPEAVKRFVAALSEVLELYNTDPQKYKSVAVENNLIPKPLAETYVMPQIPLPNMPGIEIFEDVYEWAIEEGLVKNENMTYEDQIRPEFLP